jgi:hypothetical protein
MPIERGIVMVDKRLATVGRYFAFKNANRRVVFIATICRNLGSEL